MRIIPLVVLIAVAAMPGTAQRAKPGLPLPPRGVDYVETVCTGGFDGRYEQVRVLVTGHILKATRQTPLVRAQATLREVARIWRKLDVARFERRTVRGGLYPPDGITCTLVRQQNGRVYSVVIPQLTRNEPAIADLRSVLADINELGRRATGPILRPARQ